MAKAFLIKAEQYLRLDVHVDRVDAGYPKPLVRGWSGLDDAGFERDVDCAVDLGAGKAFLFKGGNYVRLNQSTNGVDAPVKTIAEAIADHWNGLAAAGFADGIDAVWIRLRAMPQPSPPAGALRGAAGDRAVREE